MPADPAHNPTVRRANRKHGVDDDIEVRRARGEISCAECRRLKLKCDRQLPCGSCIRRGCPALCPNGTLSTGQGARSAAADSQLLARMSDRIRQLEDALAQSTGSNDHPLLREELLSIKHGQANVSAAALPNQAVEQVINTLGDMTIGERGEGKYFGRSAGTEMLVMAGAEIDHSRDYDCASAMMLPPEMDANAALFPFSPGIGDIPWDVLFKNLPAEPRAWSLCETYMEHASWKSEPIRRDQLIHEVLSPIYKAVKGKITNGVYDTSHLSAHQFAVLFFVFAVGALLDLTLEPFNHEASLYYALGRGTLALRSIFDSQEIISVQAILLMAQYKTLGSRRYTMDGSWYLVSMAVKVAQGLGLHRDSSRFRMDPKTIQRRRHLFWELFVVDSWSSLWLGRPPTIRLSDTDCEFPDDVDAVVDEHGNILMGFSRWKYEFAKDVFSSVAERMLAAEAPSYQTILELDRKLREKVLPPHLNTFLNPQDEGFSPSKYMKRCLLGQYRSMTLLYLHRSFCLQAMLEYPKNPLQSPFSPSYLAAYRCASGIVKAAINHFDRLPELCRRLWTIWTGLFSTAVIIGAIVIHSPASTIAPSAFIDLGLACDLFERGVTKGVLQSEKARSALAILNNMRAKASQAYSHTQSGRPESNYPLQVEVVDEGFDELALFGGQTKILVCEWLTNPTKFKAQQPSPPSSQPSPLIDSSTASGRDMTLTSDDTEQVHPALVDFISAFSPPDINSMVPISQGVGTSFPSSSYSGQPMPQNDSTWMNLFALSTTESFGVINPNAPIFANTDCPEIMMDGGGGSMEEQWHSFMQSFEQTDGSSIDIPTPHSEDSLAYFSQGMF